MNNFDNAAYIKYVKQRAEKDSIEMVPKTEEFKKYTQYSDFMGKFFYYCSEPINHLIVFLNLYCIYYYEDLYINVFFGIFALFVSAGCGKAAEKKCKEYQSFYEFMMINHFLLALNLFYPLMEGYLIWAVFIVLYVLLAYAEKTIFIKFQYEYLGMRANEFKAMMLDKIQKELLVNYVTEEFYQEFLEHQKKQKKLEELKLQQQQLQNQIHGQPPIQQNYQPVNNLNENAPLLQDDAAAAAGLI